MNIVDRLVEYAKMDTQSNPKSNTVPSTEKQKNLGNLLVKQLKEMGIENAHIDEMGYVYAHLKSNVGKDLKKDGFIAHMDTASYYDCKRVSLSERSCWRKTYNN